MQEFHFFSDSSKRLPQVYKLVIWDETHKKLHSINFPGTKSILEVKQDVYDLTNIPVRHQFWSGWPPQAKDDVIISIAFKLRLSWRAVVY